MLNFIDSIDKKFFLLINNGLSNPLFDVIMPLLRSPWFWSPLYLFIVLLFIKEYKFKAVWLTALVLLTVGLADYTSAGLIKPLVGRLRPCNDPNFQQQVILHIAHCGSGKSFVSTHATNHFALALLLIGVYGKRYRWVVPTAIIWASMVCFAQVYVGVHYPFDVLCGGILGSVIGYGVSKLLLPLFVRKL